MASLSVGPQEELEKLLQDSEFRNWVKAGLCLGRLKEGLDPFIEEESRDLYSAILASVRKIVQCQPCGTCTDLNNLCPGCGECKHQIESLETRYSYNKFKHRKEPDPCWKNTFITQWANYHWSVAKCYMNEGQKNVNSAADSDVSAFMNFIANCQRFHNQTVYGNIKANAVKVRNDRNKIFHKGNEKVSNLDLNNCIDNMVNLLKDENPDGKLKCRKEAKDACDFLEEVRKTSFDITIEDVQKVRLTNQIKEHGAQIQENKTHIQEHDAQIQENKTQIQEHDAQLQENKTQIQEHGAQLQENKTHIQEHDAQLQENKTHIQKHDAQLQENKTQIQEHGAQLQENKTHIQEHDAQLQENKTHIQKHDAQLQENKTHIQEHDAQLQENKTQIQEHGAQLQENKAQIQEQSVMLKEHGCKIEKHDDRLKEQRTEIQELGAQLQVLECTFQEQGAKQKVNGLSKTGLTSVQKSLIQSYKDVRTIQLNIVFRDQVENMKDYYTDIDLVEEVREKNREDREQNLKGKKEKINSLKQLFIKDNKFTRIVLKAEPGIGKSTFCRRLVDIWCRIQEKRFIDASEEELSSELSSAGMKDWDVMQRFDILLYLNLGEISGEKELIDVIYTQIPILKRVDLTAVMDEVENNRVLLIMDGLDEMVAPVMYIEQILKRKLFPFVTVVVTSRPWKIGEIGLSLDTHIDLLISLEGFSEDNSMKFAEKIFEIDYKDKSVMNEFQKNLEKVKICKQLIHVPLLNLFLVHIWYQKKSFPETIYQLYHEMLDVLVARYKERNRNVPSSCQEKSSSELKEFPKLQKLMVTQTFGEEFLLDFCEIANHFLFGKKQENSIIFEEEALLEKLGTNGKSRLQQALDVGLLSKQDCTTKGDFKRKVRLSFPHKTIQEFLTAIYICCKEKQFDQFLEMLKTYDCVLQNETTITFLAGISPQRCEKIFEKIFEACSDDGMIFDKIVLANKYFIQLPPISRLYMNCLLEASKKVHLKLRHLYANNLQDLDTILNTIKSASDIRILALNEIDFTLNQCQLQFDLSKFNNLKYLLLQNMNMVPVKVDLSCACSSLCVVKMKQITLSSENVLLLCDTLSKCSQLEELTFYKQDTSRVSPFLCVLIPDDATPSSSSDVLLSHALTEIKQNLKEFESIPKSNKECKVHFDFHSNVKHLKLREIHLEHVKLDFPSLYKLSLEKITISSENYVQLWNNLSQYTQLKVLTVEDIDVVDSKHDLTFSLSGPRMESMTSLKECALSLCTFLSKQTQLLELTLADVDLFDACLDLSAASSLSLLSLNNVTMNSESAVLLCNSLSKCHDLHILILIDVDLKDALLKPPNVKKRLCLYLDNILISSQCAKDLQSLWSDVSFNTQDIKRTEHMFSDIISRNPLQEGTQFNLSQMHFMPDNSFEQTPKSSGRFRLSGSGICVRTILNEFKFVRFNAFMYANKDDR